MCMILRVCVVTASYVPCNRIRVVSLRARNGEHTGKHTGKQRMEQGGSAEPEGAGDGDRASLRSFA